MARTHRVLILGGTGEAVALAARLSKLPNLEVTTSLAGVTKRPVRPHGQVRVGGFGGVPGLAGYLRDANIDLLVDATHPFAAVISAHAAEASLQAGSRLLRLARPAWEESAGDRWIRVESPAAAAQAVQGLSERVFLTVGRKDLDAFADLPDIWFLVRLIEPLSRPLPLRRYETVVGRPPFCIKAETALLRARRIGALVSKNSGGDATYGKIEAARVLDLPVVMIERPKLPLVNEVNSVKEAMAWIAARLS